MNLDSTASKLAKKWSFEPTEELPGGHCSKVYATADRVLKVPFRGEEMDSGYWAMIRIEKPFGPTIFESDPENGSLLMERAVPGTKLHQSGLTEEEQQTVWKSIAFEFRKMKTDRLMPMEKYARSSDPLVRLLLATTSKNVALHGDLHHENILRHGDGWMCIDAKGLSGDPAVEGAAFVCNPFPEVGLFSPGQFIDKINRVASLLEVNPFRVWGWSVARMREDVAPVGEPWHHALVALNKCAETFGGERWVLSLT